MKKLIILFFSLILLAQNAVFASDVKFAVLSDVHISLSKKNVNGRNLTESINYLQKAVRQINASDNDFVIFCGDAIDKTDKKSLVIFAKIISKLKKPCYVIIGNHDVVQVLDIDKKEFFHLVNLYSHNKIHKVPTVRKMKSGLVFIFMDGVNQFIPGPSGNYKESELMWLDKKLTKYKNKKVVIVQHFPLVPPYHRTTHMTQDADKYLNMLSKHNNVFAIISGHFHEEGQFYENGIYHVSIPALVQGGEYKEIVIEKQNSNNYVIKSKIQSVN